MRADDNPTVATDDDLPGFLRVLAAWAPMHRRRLNEAADRIDYLEKREAYLVAELNACSHIPTGDKDGLA